MLRKKVRYTRSLTFTHCTCSFCQSCFRVFTVLLWNTFENDGNVIFNDYEAFSCLFSLPFTSRVFLIINCCSYYQGWIQHFECCGVFCCGTLYSTRKLSQHWLVYGDLLAWFSSFYHCDEISTLLQCAHFHQISSIFLTAVTSQLWTRLGSWTLVHLLADYPEL